MGEALKKTPLYDAHVALQGKLVPFAGFEMPVQYPTGITAEHHAVRKTAGLFDVCHMGEFLLEGPQALDLIQKITVNDASALNEWQAQYSAMCLESGGIIDDLLVYRGPGHYMLVVNASNKNKDLAWVEKHAQGFDVEVTDKSDATALLAIQGPLAAEIVGALTASDLEGIGYYRFALGDVAGVDGMISRTGYTGEDGFELYVPAEGGMGLWNALMEEGAARGLIPTGLGCRDSLRLEMGYALYGNDLDDEHTPLESGLGWITKLDKGNFIGRDVLVKQKEEGVTRRLVGMKLSDTRLSQARVSRGLPGAGRRRGDKRRGQSLPGRGCRHGVCAYRVGQTRHGGGSADPRQGDSGRGPASSLLPTWFRTPVREPGPDPLQIGVLTVSDACSEGSREDMSGGVLEEWCIGEGYEVVIRATVPDETSAIVPILLRWADGGTVDVILTTGGTGFGPRDVTPEATQAVLDRLSSGLSEAIRRRGEKATAYAALSRGLAGSRGRVFLANLPGSPGGVRDGSGGARSATETHGRPFDFIQYPSSAVVTCLRKAVPY